MSEKIYQATKDGSLQEVSLPEYVCHKVVRAAKIVAVGIGPDPGPEAAPGTRRGVRLALEGAAHVDVSQQWMQNKFAQPGGYFVQYEDGYSSFSPAKAFEEGYVKAETAGEKKRPTIEELEAILAENDDQIAIKINPDGSITAYPKDTAQVSALSAAIGTKTVELPAAEEFDGGMRHAAADTSELTPTAPLPRDIPEGALVTVKGGSGRQFTVGHIEQVNGRRFVSLKELPQLFHEDQLIPVPAATEVQQNADPTSGDDSEATDRTSSSEPEPSSTQPRNSDSSTDSSGTQEQDASSSQDQTGTTADQPTEESPAQADQAEPQPEQPAAAGPNAAISQSDLAG
jgi:hypothetical protein